MKINNDVKRPLLRYLGGKWILAPWIVSHMPKHRVYVEPFGGGAAVLLRKNRSHAEIYNDLDSEIVNLFRVLRDPEAAHRLVELIALTPFALDEYNLSYEACSDPIEQARRTVIRSHMSFNAEAMSGAKVGFRDDARRANRTPSNTWTNYPDGLLNVISRLTGVVIHNKKAEDLISQFDSHDTLFYIDPPYVPGTRISGKYLHEMGESEHIDLATLLHTVEGKVMISGYPCDLYDEELYSDWHRVERFSTADGGGKRTEILWMNFEAYMGPLFEGIE